jgi:hypothetical protein
VHQHAGQDKGPFGISVLLVRLSEAESNHTVSSGVVTATLPTMARENSAFRIYTALITVTVTVASWVENPPLRSSLVKPIEIRAPTLETGQKEARLRINISTPIYLSVLMLPMQMVKPGNRDLQDVTNQGLAITSAPHYREAPRAHRSGCGLFRRCLSIAIRY